MTIRYLSSPGAVRARAAAVAAGQRAVQTFDKRPLALCSEPALAEVPALHEAIRRGETVGRVGMVFG
jgi:hypothetical protein